MCIIIINSIIKARNCIIADRFINDFWLAVSTKKVTCRDNKKVLRRIFVLLICDQNGIIFVILVYDSDTDACKTNISCKGKVHVRNCQQYIT